MIGGMNNFMKQAQKLQKQMEKMQLEHASKEFEAMAGGDMVSVRVNGKSEILKVTIKKEVVDPDDIGLLEDLVASAVNAAIKKASEAGDSGMKDMTKGLGLPGF